MVVRRNTELLVRKLSQTSTVLAGSAAETGLTRCHTVCSVANGGHELYRARTETRLYQQCLLCGYETAGWTIERKDRRLHLVTHTKKTSVAARR